MTTPAKRNRTLPKAMFLLVLAFVAAAIVYSALNQAPWSWPVPEEAKQLKNPLQPTAAAVKSAREVYADKCAHCHGDTGKGDGPDASRYDPAPMDFTDAKRMNEATDGELFYKISEGKKPMPVFKNKLTEDQRWELVLLIRSFGGSSPSPNQDLTSSRREDQQVRAIAETIGEKYCYGDAQLFAVWLKLRVKYFNETQTTLILDKEIGKAWFQIVVARNREDLNTGKYEYAPNTDWMFSDKDQFPRTPHDDAPDQNFAILRPGEFFQDEVNTAIFVPYPNAGQVSGSVRPGTHVLQIQLSAWNRGGAFEFAKKWSKYGELVTGVITTEPIEIRVPSNPQVKAKCP